MHCQDRRFNRKKPLSYPCRQVVLEYFEANSRFNFANRCPTIRPNEKTAPLHIDLLVLNHNRLTVNRTDYHLGVIRNYANKPIPVPHQKDNKAGGLHFDLDPYGFRNLETDNYLAPDDIFLVDGGRFDWVDSQEQSRMDELEGWANHYGRQYAREVEILKKEQLKKNKQLNKRKNDDEDTSKKTKKAKIEYDSTDSEDENTIDTLIQNPNHRGLPIEKIKKYKEQMDTMLLPFQCRKQQVAPAFRPEIQLKTSKKSENSKSTIQRYSYNKKLHEAIRSLNHRILGGRKKAINVKRLHVYTSDKTLRVPKNVEIKCKELKVFTGFFATTHNDLKSIISKMSYPFQTLGTEIRNIQELDEPAVQSAERLLISNELIDLDFVNALKKLYNKRVHVQYDRIQTEDYPNIAINFKEAQMGTCHSFAIKNLNKCEWILEEIQSEHLSRSEGTWMQIPLGFDSELLIFRSSINTIQEKHPKYAITMKVVPVDLNSKEILDICNQTKMEITEMIFEDPQHLKYSF